MSLIKGILMFIVGISGTAFTIVWIIKMIIESMEDNFIIPNHIEDDSLDRIYDSEISNDTTHENVNSTILLDDFEQDREIN